jgi:hypothetical protein
MLSGKQETAMSDDEVRRIIEKAIFAANIDYPASYNGTRWSEYHREPEECRLLADAVLTALRDAGYEIKKAK